VECLEHHVRLRLPHGPAARRQVLQSSHLGRSQKQPDEPNNEADQRLDVVAVLDRTRFRRRNTDLQMHIEPTMTQQCHARLYPFCSRMSHTATKPHFSRVASVVPWC